jgi:hypothetical protein
MPSDPAASGKIAALKADRKKLQAEKKRIDEERATIDKVPKTWAALSTAPAALKVLKRGDVLAPAEDAPPGALSAIRLVALAPSGGAGAATEARRGEGCRPFHADQAAGGSPAGDIGISTDDPDPVRRLKLADWIADADNPLTWRVIVNRVWQYHFGAGLVTTPSDFGLAGARPSHPELLDWLADEFRRSGGRFKALHRMIVRSAVYRQAPTSFNPQPQARTGSEQARRKNESKAEFKSPRPERPGRAEGTEIVRPGVSDWFERALAIDADNRLLWRPNRRRLDAETLRDSILLTSGSLDLAAGGASYRPFQYIEGNIPVYEPAAESPALWRRTVYRHVVRTHRQPFLDTFDCPDPSVMTSVRTQTTTPLQALSLLNNPFVIEQSRRFAERVIGETGPDMAHQARSALRLILLKELSGDDLEATAQFVRLYGLDSLCRVLFNTNEFLYVD